MNDNSIGPQRYPWPYTCNSLWCRCGVWPSLGRRAVWLRSMLCRPRSSWLFS